MNVLNKILKLCKVCNCELHESYNGKYYLCDQYYKIISCETMDLNKILHILRKYLQHKLKLEVEDFDYINVKESDIFKGNQYSKKGEYRR